MKRDNKAKPTKAMRIWLRTLHRRETGEDRGFYLPDYTMAGRMRDIGVVEIVNEPGKMGWPFSGWTIKLTEAGRAAIGAP